MLAVEPFYGGSHRAFIDGAATLSRHAWTLITGKPIHWKWRMRSAPLELAQQADQTIESGGFPDVIFCSSMLDLPTWRGMIRGSRLSNVPTAVYFHENQWTYPQSPMARVDHHFGYTNLLTAIACDACWFNSQFHRDDFLQASEAFVRRMPDTQSSHDFDRLRQRCEVIPPGFAPPVSMPQRETRSDDRPIRIGWVSRWEYDKRPDRFVELLSLLSQGDVDYELVLLGARPQQTPESLTRLRDCFGSRILHDGFVDSPEEYWHHLQSMDIVVSTADHEFFGIAICEAIWAGAAPVLPNRLSYPEWVPTRCLYQTLDDAASMIHDLRDAAQREIAARGAREKSRSLTMTQTVAKLDDALQRLTD